MKKEKGAWFTQSLSDFPVTVALGEKRPAWSLTRWCGNNGLRFVPPDDEGFTLRGVCRKTHFFQDFQNIKKYYFIKQTHK